MPPEVDEIEDVLSESGSSRPTGDSRSGKIMNKASLDSKAEKKSTDESHHVSHKKKNGKKDGKSPEGSSTKHARKKTSAVEDVIRAKQ